MALYHFHRAGLYGVGANIVAIPLTTFVIMPLEAGALLLDVVGWGKPLWWLCGARSTGCCGSRTPSPRPAARSPAAVDARLGVRADGRAAGSGCACGTRGCGCSGLLRSSVGAVGAAIRPAPDLLVTGDGTHLGRGGDGRHAH